MHIISRSDDEIICEDTLMLDIYNDLFVWQSIDEVFNKPSSSRDMQLLKTL